MVALTAGLFAQETRGSTSFVPTPQEVVDRMLEIAKVRKGEFLIDLGSGDGRIAVTAAKKSARAASASTSTRTASRKPTRTPRSRTSATSSSSRQNLFETDISKADVITMYLLTELNLGSARSCSTSSPARGIVSHAFNMGDWMPDQKETGARYDVYLWIVPAKVEGRWTVQRGEKTFTVALKQKYQEFDGHRPDRRQVGPGHQRQAQRHEIAFDIQVDNRTARSAARSTATPSRAPAAGRPSARLSRAAGHPNPQTRLSEHHVDQQSTRRAPASRSATASR